MRTAVCGPCFFVGDTDCHTGDIGLYDFLWDRWGANNGGLRLQSSIVYHNIYNLQYQQQAQGYEEFFVGIFPEEHEQQQEHQQVAGVQVS